MIFHTSHARITRRMIMATSRYCSRVVLTLFALTVLFATAKAADPGIPPAPPTAVSDQKAGSILFYPFYSSSSTDPASDSRIAVTNSSTTNFAFVHIFLVSAASCSVADFFSCFTPAQTTYFLTSMMDPGTSGYIVMIAVNGINGCPEKFNHLIGDGFVKLASGLHGNYGAEAIAAIADPPAVCDDTAGAALIQFDGINYELVPKVLALDSVPSIGDGYNTRIWVARTGGNLFASGGSVGPLFGVLYNDAEQGLSFSINNPGCIVTFAVNDTDVRTAPRPSIHIPANSAGWIRFWTLSPGGIFGFAASAKAGLADVPDAFAGGRNLHKLRLTTDAYLMPIFPPTC